MPFYKQYKGTKTKPTGLVGYVFHRDYAISPHNVALLVHENPGPDTAVTRDSLTQFDSLYGIVADEGIDKYCLLRWLVVRFNDLLSTRLCMFVLLFLVNNLVDLSIAHEWQI
ncbi:hypothetical protein SDJN02_16394, partial [Cucurbita argyrosperma subsp. argyrosperma]